MRPCPSCGSTQVETDEKLGHIVCVGCGGVMEENTIVSEVTFTETSKGATLADGFQVGSGQARANHKGSFGLVRTGSMESREQTIQNGHRRIQEVANQPQIRMSERLVESALRFFNLAVINNFNRGRKANNVVAACLYIVCRMEKTAHMLIDFADALSTNVYQLGATFLALVQLVNVKLPLVDPSLYISRFASRLDFSESTQAVIKDANRLVQRMNRDWLNTGRRPSGICAAALFIAARMHGFQRTIREIILVVKICQGTLRKRLSEFQQTPSSELSVSDFQTIWLEEEKDPPAFKRNVNMIAKDLITEEPADIMTNDEFNTVGLDEEVDQLLNLSDTKEIAESVAVDLKQTEESLSDLDDDAEIKIMLDVTQDEIEFKNMVWTNENADWITKQETKEEKPVKIIKPRKARKKAKMSATSAVEATKNLIESKPNLSRKINYEVLENLFDNNASDPTSQKMVDMGLSVTGLRG